MDKQTWDTCPQELLLSIFRYLEPKDLIRASSMCKNWRQAQQDPSLWRRWTFRLDASHRDSTQNLLHLCNCYGHHLHHVRIECPKINRFNDIRSIVDFLNSVLSCLANLSQGRPAIESFHICLPRLFPDFEDHGYHEVKVLTSIIGDFLESRPTLREVRIHGNLAENLWTEAEVLFDGIVRVGSVPHIQLLDLRLMGGYTCWSAHDWWCGRQIRSVFSRFPRLTELDISYPLLYEVTIQATCQILKDLHTLVIYYLSAEEVISTRDWLEAVGLCPRLRVTLHAHKFYMYAPMFLVAGMPLTTFTFAPSNSVNVVDLIVQECAYLLETMSRLFPDTLESITLRDETRRNQDDNLNASKEMFINCIRKCPRLRRLAVFRPLMTEVLRDEIRQDLLHTFHLEQDVLVVI